MSDMAVMHPLKLYREEKQLSQQELADKLEVSRQLIGMIETGVRGATAALAVRIETRLGIDRALIRPDLFQRPAAVIEQG